MSPCVNFFVDKTLVSPSLDPGADSKVENKGLETPDMGPNMQYLSLTNEERNQYTTTSITSNLALYEVGTDAHASPYQLPFTVCMHLLGAQVVMLLYMYVCSCTVHNGTVHVVLVLLLCSEV